MLKKRLMNMMLFNMVDFQSMFRNRFGNQFINIAFMLDMINMMTDTVDIYKEIKHKKEKKKNGTNNITNDNISGRSL